MIMQNPFRLIEYWSYWINRYCNASNQWF